jgi:hypothetical protein
LELLARRDPGAEKRSPDAVDKTARRGRRCQHSLGGDEVARVPAFELAFGGTDDPDVAVAALPATDRMTFLEVRAELDA